MHRLATMNRLPNVPALDGAPVADASKIIAEAYAGAARNGVSAASAKPSGAWFRKAREAKARGITPPPRPMVHLPPARDDAPPPPPARAENGNRLSAADVEAAAVAQGEQVQAAERAEILTLQRPQIEKRVGALGALGFRLAGILLGDEAAFALSDVQREELAVLFVEAFPDECAQLVQSGNLAKVLAVGTLAQIVRAKWTYYQARKLAPQAPEPARIQSAPAPEKFGGLPDMAA